MNKGNLIEEIQKNISRSLNKEEVKEVIETYLDVIKTELVNNGIITINGFGTFRCMERRSTTAINPQNQEKLDVPAKRVGKFQFSKAFNMIINEAYKNGD